MARAEIIKVQFFLRGAEAMTPQEYGAVVKRNSPKSKTYVNCLAAFCIGGGICNERGYLLDPLNELVEREQYTRENAQKSKIVVAELGNDAGIIGAAWLGK